MVNILGLLDWADNTKESELSFIPEQTENAKDYFKLYRQDASWFLRDQCAHIRSQYFGFLPQHGHLLRIFSTRQNLSLVARLRNGSKSNNIDEAIRKILSKVGFDKEELDSSPAQLSGGQAQRLVISPPSFTAPKLFSSMNQPHLWMKHL